MMVEIDLQSNKCRFPECRHYNNGICESNKHRNECMDIALAVLSIDEVADERTSGGYDLQT